MTFDEYVDSFVAKRATAEATAHAGGLPMLDRIALKVGWLIETNQAVLPADAKGAVLASLVAKLSTELLAFTGAIRMGALDGAWQHVRALIELRGAVHYLFSDPKESSRRVEQFTEFEEMMPWVRRKTLENDFNAGRLTKAQFDAQNFITDSRVAHATPSRMKRWRALFGTKLLSRARWHAGGAKELLTAVDPTGDLYFQYQMVCHTVHVSPVGHRFGGFGPPRLVGYSPAALNTALGAMFLHARAVLGHLDPHLGGVVRDGVVEEVRAFLAWAGGAVPDMASW